MRFRLALALAAIVGSPAFAQAESCWSERGDAAKSLVEQCLDVSPATHPPCNAENACDLIESEISRGCGLLDGKTRPKFCRDF